MPDYRILFPILISFIVSLLFIPGWIKKVREIGLVWPDMNKFKSEKIAGSGGIIAVLGFILGALLFIAYRTFYLKTSSYLIEILAIITVIILLGGIGLIDDLFGWQSGGLSIGQRVFFVIFAAIPLMAINSGKAEMLFPFVGVVQLGIFYPLILIPIGILGATTTFNFLAGFNGLEAGQGIIFLSALGIVAYFTGNSWLLIIALCMVAALIAFLFYNFFPAKVFPGDTLTYAVGGLIAVIAILGNFEKIAVFFFIPYIIETGLKLRGKLEKWSFGKPNKDGSLDLRYDKIYGLEHLAILIFKHFNVQATEKRVVYLIWGFQILIILIGFVIFREGIFNYVK